ncbi:E3 ubiquitin-protein ligase TRAIP-like isoform X2 [Plodia interpunctella]|uniref:E3 ubiquitin-protein ligase TRAIP-like isoform X2 n=1 Tax=Plodia interpunctella TaxID=58824 RepID=UPI0023674A93|nr:E3 ubiquitin-protein ligase TRAIP-like isoform X2 [Plodia interpunctella]
MKITCTICTELIRTNEDFKVTKCGHLFHNSCLSDWLLRSQSCPQCRCTVTSNATIQVYPTLSDEATDIESIQSNLDEALHKVQELHVAREEKENLLRAATEDLTKNDLNCIVEILKEQLDTMEMHKERLEIENNEANKEMRRLKEDAKQYQEKIRSLKEENQTSQELTNSLEQQTDDLKKEVQTLNEKTLILEEQRQDLTNEIQCLKDEMQPPKQFAHLEVGIRRLEEELLRLEPQTNKLQEEKKILQEENKLYQAEIERLKNGILSLVEGSLVLGDARRPKQETQKETKLSTVKQSSDIKQCLELVGKSEIKEADDETQRLDVATNGKGNCLEKQETEVNSVSEKASESMFDEAQHLKVEIQISEEQVIRLDEEIHLNENTQQKVEIQFPEEDPVEPKEMLLEEKVESLTEEVKQDEKPSLEETLSSNDLTALNGENKCLKNEMQDSNEDFHLVGEGAAVKKNSEAQQEDKELSKDLQ